MKQLTIRGFDEDLERRLQEVAAREGTSLNKAALSLLRRGAGLEEPEAKPQVIGRSLDSFFGTWTAAEEQEFRQSQEIFEQIDESLWG